MKILLATDGSAYSKAVIDEIANRSYPINTQVRIVSVYDRVQLITATGPMGVSQEYYAAADLQASKAAEEAIESGSKILHKKNPSLTISTIVIQGSPKSSILEEAEKFGADLIGYGAVERFLLGSVSQAVALHAKCSVEIVRK
jgi:nucleotide-binding universal stress UspA family protein